MKQMQHYVGGSRSDSIVDKLDTKTSSLYSLAPVPNILKPVLYWLLTQLR